MGVPKVVYPGMGERLRRTRLFLGVVVGPDGLGHDHADRVRGDRVLPAGGEHGAVSAYVNVESVIDHHAELPPGVDAFRARFEETIRRGDHWMTWNLGARSRADLEEVARRLGGEVVTAPGARRPDGTTGTTIMAPGDASKTWARGLPNRYFHEDLTRHPARLAPMDHERPLREIAWLEVGGDPAEVEEHVGAETFAALPLRFVDGPAGLHGVGLATPGR